MRRIGLVVTLCLLLCSCDKAVKREVVGRTVQQEQEQSCSHTDYCYTCMPGFDGKMNCGFKLSYACSGTERVVVDIVPYRVTYESGKVEYGQESRWVRTIEECH